jgi:hypothetical protein
MCAPSWEVLVKKSELNPQKLAFLSGYGPSTLTAANNDRSQVWFRSQPPSQVSQPLKFPNHLSWIKAAVLADSKIDKLTAGNYHTWRQKIELVLAFCELDEVVFNTGSTNTLQDAAAIAEFRKKDAKAKTMIGLTLCDEHLEHVRGANSAAEMWLAIKNVFQRTSLLKKLAARRRFYTVSIADGERILTYINRVK